MEYKFCSGNVGVRFDIFPVYGVHLQNYIAESLYRIQDHNFEYPHLETRATGQNFLFTERPFFVADQKCRLRNRVISMKRLR